MPKKVITYEDNAEFFERTETELTPGKTQRGFGYFAFEDRSGVKCSIQDSSLATEPAIWLGVDDPDPKILVPSQGWQSYPIPPEVSIKTRMHLTQTMVKQLLPLLKRFAQTGDYLDLNPPKKKPGKRIQK